MWIHRLKEHNNDIHNNPLTISRVEKTTKQAINILLNSENKEYYTKRFIMAIHHWETPGNTNKNTGKSIHEWLTQNGINQIKKVANQYKQSHLNTKDIIIHIPPWVKRNVQSARIFCKELWLPFPESDEIFFKISDIQTYKSFLQDIANRIINWEEIDFDLKYTSEWTKDEEKINSEKLLKVLSQISTPNHFVWTITENINYLIKEKLITLDTIKSQIKILTQEEDNLQEQAGLDKLNYIQLDNALSTTKKWKETEWNYYPASIVKQNEYWREPVTSVRIKNANYINTQLQKTPKNHIFVLNRAGIEGFLDVKQNRKNLEYKFNSKPWEVIMWYINNNGNFINQTNKKNFEFNLEKYKEQIEEFKTILWLKINENNSLIKNQNIINEYLTWLRGHLFISKEPPKEKETKIKRYLYKNNKTLQKYTVFTLLDVIKQEHTINIKKILTDRIWTEFTTGSNIDLNNQIKYFDEFYKNKEKTDLWKYILYKLKSQDNNISNKLKNLTHNQDIKKELELIDQHNKFQHQKLETLFWTFELDDIYITQYLENDNGKTFDTTTFISNFIKSPKDISTITAGWGYGKSTLMKKLKQDLSDYDFLFKNNLWNTFIQDINISDISWDTIDEDFIIKSFPTYTRPKKSQNKYIFMLDWIDELQEEKRNKFIKLIKDKAWIEKHPNIKFILSSREFETSLFYDSEDYKISNHQKKQIKRKRKNIDKNELLWNYDLNILIDTYLPKLKSLKKYPEKKETLRSKIQEICQNMEDETSPLIVEMICHIADSWYRNFQKLINPEQTISRKTIYDIFWEDIQNREWGKRRDYSNINEDILTEKYDKMRKEFLSYLAIHSEEQEIEQEKLEEYFNIFSKKNNLKINKKDQNDLLKTLIHIGILRTTTNGKIKFIHNTFKDYFGYIAYKQYEDSGILKQKKQWLIKSVHWEIDTDTLKKDIKELLNIYKFCEFNNEKVLFHFLDSLVDIEPNIMESIKQKHWIKEDKDVVKLLTQNEWWANYTGKLLQTIFKLSYLDNFLENFTKNLPLASYKVLHKLDDGRLTQIMSKNLDRIVNGLQYEINEKAINNLKLDFERIKEKMKTNLKYKVNWNLKEEIENILQQAGISKDDIDVGVREELFYGFASQSIRYLYTWRR